MCKLALAAGCHNPHTSTNENCMLPTLGDFPKWTVPIEVEHHNTSYSLEPFCAYRCPDYSSASSSDADYDCFSRAFHVRKKNINFHSQERTLHGSTADPASSAACPQMLSMITIREPIKHVVSHMLQVLDVYEVYLNKFSSLLRTFMLPGKLPFWQRLAPAVLDNYYTRTLLGRHFMCLPFGSIKAQHAQHAAAKLLGFDIILDLDQSQQQQDQILNLGLGWEGSMADAHERRSVRKIERTGMRSADVLPSLQAWNAHDQEVYRHGSAMAQLDAIFFATAAGAVQSQAERYPHASGEIQRLPGANVALDPLDMRNILAMAAAYKVNKKRCGLISNDGSAPAGAVPASR